MYSGRQLQRRRLPLGALVLNKVLPSWLCEPAGSLAAEALGRDPRGVASAVAAAVGGLDVGRAATVLAEAAASYRRLALAADREAVERDRLAARPAVTVALPHEERDVTDLPALAGLGRSLWADPSGAPAPRRRGVRPTPSRRGPDRQD